MLDLPYFATIEFRLLFGLVFPVSLAHVYYEIFFPFSRCLSVSMRRRPKKMFLFRSVVILCQAVIVQIPTDFLSFTNPFAAAFSTWLLAPFRRQFLPVSASTSFPS